MRLAALLSPPAFKLFGRVGCAALLALTGCHGDPSAPAALLLPHQAGTPLGPEKLEYVSDAEVQRVAKFPVIDVHTHTFNALYLPLMNICLARSHEFPLGIFLNEGTVRILVGGIVHRALENQSSGRDASGIVGNASARTAAEFGITREDVTRGLISANYIGVGPEKEGVLPDIEKVLNDPGAWQRLGEALIGEDDEDSSIGPRTKAAKRLSFVTFLSRLVKNDGLLRREQKIVYPSVRLYVHHTMDMGPTYGQSRSEAFYDFHSTQMDHVRRLDQNDDDTGPYLHFVAFNPFLLGKDERTEPEGGWQNSRAITLIAEAINQGAWGVKYYPPAGYRPSHNEIPSRPWNSTLAKQWDARYAGFTNKALDGLNRALFEYCSKNNIPVFAHSQYGEFQARPHYGAAMANPSYYLPILEEFRDLRLCFGHAGGSPFWFSNGKAAERVWGEQVYEVCTRFRNVYCEVGIFSEIADEALRDRFVLNLGELLARPTPYKFGTKILYGTDWPMPNAIKVESIFLSRYQDAFNRLALHPHYEDFFSRNAVRYLDLSPKNSRMPLLPGHVQKQIAVLADDMSR
jgi:predicted TIM-barrel fold metal-dependent hydrolase